MSEQTKNDFCGDGNCKHIRGINCDVQNCIHHNGDCYCTAESISVGPSHACCSTETVCATFSPKGE